MKVPELMDEIPSPAPAIGELCNQIEARPLLPDLGQAEQSGEMRKDAVWAVYGPLTPDLMA